jgi:hypothetical protein
MTPDLIGIIKNICIKLKKIFYIDRSRKKPCKHYRTEWGTRIDSEEGLNMYVDGKQVTKKIHYYQIICKKCKKLLRLSDNFDN